MPTYALQRTDIPWGDIYSSSTARVLPRPHPSVYTAHPQSPHHTVCSFISSANVTWDGSVSERRGIFGGLCSCDSASSPGIVLEHLRFLRRRRRALLEDNFHLAVDTHSRLSSGIRGRCTRAVRQGVGTWLDACGQRGNCGLGAGTRVGADCARVGIGCGLETGAGSADEGWMGAGGGRGCEHAWARDVAGQHGW